jgi:hypothetical protein
MMTCESITFAYLVWHDREFPVEIWQNTPEAELPCVASHALRATTRVRLPISYPIRSDNRIFIETKENVGLMQGQLQGFPADEIKHFPRMSD